MFNISRDKIDRWLKRRETTGSVKAAQGYQQEHSHRIKDWQEFRAFAQTYGAQTHFRDGAIVARQDQSTHHCTSIGTDWLDSKKKTYGYRERDATKRAAYLVDLSTIAPSKRVYVDESGMDERDDYGYGWCMRGQRFEALLGQGVGVARGDVIA